MRMKFFLFFFLLMAMAVMAQTPVSDVPELYEKVLSQEVLAAITTVIGGVKLLRNVINVKGFLAVVITIGASLVYGLIQFGFGPYSVTYGLTVGILAALTFYLTKNLGTILGAFGLSNAEAAPAIYQRSVEFLKKFSDPKNLIIGLLRIVKYVLVRR